MDPLLANLTKIPNVIAAGVFAASGACTEFVAIDAGYEPVILLGAIHAAEEALNVFRSGDGLAEASMLSLELEHGFFLYRRAGAARLAVLANANVNVALLEVSVNAITLKLAGVFAQDHAPQNAPFPAYATTMATAGAGPMAGVPGVMPGTMYGSHPGLPGMMPGTLPGTPGPLPIGAMPGAPRGTSPMPAPRPTGSQSSVSTPVTSSGSSSGIGETWTADELTVNGLRVRGTVGHAVMHHVLKALTRYVGIHAKAILVEELARLSATPATVMPVIFTDFIHNVASRIPDPGVHDEFIDLALGDRK